MTGQRPLWLCGIKSSGQEKPAKQRAGEAGEEGAWLAPYTE